MRGGCKNGGVEYCALHDGSYQGRIPIHVDAKLEPTTTTTSARLLQDSRRIEVEPGEERKGDSLATVLLDDGGEKRQG